MSVHNTLRKPHVPLVDTNTAFPLDISVRLGRFKNPLVKPFTRRETGPPLELKVSWPRMIRRLGRVMVDIEGMVLS